MMAISAIAAPGQGGDYGIVKGDGVRPRTSTSASSDSDVLGLLYNGERLNITSGIVGWAYGQKATGENTGKWGYVSTSYLTLYQQ
jgi:hypothetical protein